MIHSPPSGQVVDLLEDSQIVAAVCLEERKGKLRLLTESGREVSVSSKQVVHVHALRLDIDQAREALTRALQSRATCRQALMATVDMSGLWEVLKDEAGDFAATELAELALNEAGDDQVAAVLGALYRDRVYFRARGEGFRPTDATTVAAILTQRTREEEKAIRTRRVSEWLRAVWDGQLVSAPPEGPEIIEMLKDVALNGEEARTRERLMEILRAAGLNEEGAPFQLLVRLGTWALDENLMLLRLDTRCEHPPEVLSAASLLAQVSRWSWQDLPREDLTERTIYTVDSATTRDVDDGLSLTAIHGGFEVGIHITDVATVIPQDSILDSEARLRGTSIYLPDLLIPMLPTVISEGLCSLEEGVLRPAVSLLLTVDEAGTVCAQRFALTVVRVTQHVTYKEVDAALASDNSSPWHTLLTIARAWRAARRAQGALFLAFPEVTVMVGEGGEARIEREDRETGAQVLVSEMMIQVNRLTAMVLKEAGIACLYRSQAAPRERLFDGVVPHDLWLNYRQRMQLSRAETGVEPAVHHGLGIDAYVTASSPLRRYADLVNQRQFIAFLRGKSPPYSVADLNALLTTIERPVSQASLLEQNRRRYWLLRVLEQRRGLEVIALVVAIFGHRIQITLPEFMLETVLSTATHSNLQPGQWLRVRITRVQALEDILRVEVIADYANPM
ncbi:exoribonuclease II [Gammaproteobacteria bacterium]